ncbi:hypothetical protein HY640_05140 [Candidatus Woesearchaeota archaeon]|nr:hypothetical protein [Candidatus Woesearchaeota archaeon]
MSQYYEAVLQLRHPDDSVVAFVEDALAKAGQGVLVSHRRKAVNGVDYYLSSNRFAVDLGRRLVRRFSGRLKLSRRIFGRDRQTSRDLYRVTVLYECIPIRQGDILSCGGIIVRVSSLGRSIVGLNLDTGKRQFLDLSSECSVLEVRPTTVARVYPVLEVLDPDTFQGIELFGAPSGLKPGQKVKVSVHGGRAYFVR